jgi:hypothetical protein
MLKMKEIGPGGLSARVLWDCLEIRSVTTLEQDKKSEEAMKK